MMSPRMVMSRPDRFASALDGRRSAPVAFWQHHPLADQHCDGFVDATLDYQRAFGFDLVKMTPASTYQSRDYGLQDAWNDDPIGRRDVVGRVVQRPQDWLTLPELSPEQGFVARYPQALAIVRRQTPSGVPVLATVFDPFFQASQLAGLDRLLLHLRQSPDAVAAGLDRITRNTLALIDAYRSAGADGIFLACQHANDSVPLDIYRAYGAHGARRCLRAAARMPVTMLHLHGRGIHHRLFSSFGDVVLHYDACAGNPAPEQITPTMFDIISTGPCHQALLEGRGASVARDIVARCASRRFLLSAGCTVPLAVGHEALHAVVEAVRGTALPRAGRTLVDA